MNLLKVSFSIMDCLLLTSLDDVAQIFHTVTNADALLIIVHSNMYNSIYKINITTLLVDIIKKDGFECDIYLSYSELSDSFLIRFIRSGIPVKIQGEIINSTKINSSKPCYTFPSGIIHVDSIKNIQKNTDDDLILKFDINSKYFCLELISEKKKLIKETPFLSAALKVFFSGMALYLTWLWTTHVWYYTKGFSDS